MMLEVVYCVAVSKLVYVKTCYPADAESFDIHFKTHLITEKVPTDRKYARSDESNTTLFSQMQFIFQGCIADLGKYTSKGMWYEVVSGWM